jgi:hypothetical protein
VQINTIEVNFQQTKKQKKSQVQRKFKIKFSNLQYNKDLVIMIKKNVWKHYWFTIVTKN